MAWTHAPEKSYGDYDEMLADPKLDAVIIATSDAFHVPASIKALKAGKHVLCEKPVGIGLEEVLELEREVTLSGKRFQVGHMKRYDIGLQEAKRFIADEMGEIVSLKAWYCDSTHRYAMTDAVQPLIVKSANALKPSQDPKADLTRYYMLAHGCHLVDTARYFAGDITAVNARLSRNKGMHCWFVARVDGQIVHYDVAHQLKLPTRPVLPGLNPVPGVRFLAAVGKGLRLPFAGSVLELPHFARFIWLTEDGREHHPAHALLLDAKQSGADRISPDGPSC